MLKVLFILFFLFVSSFCFSLFLRQAWRNLLICILAIMFLPSFLISSCISSLFFLSFLLLFSLLNCQRTPPQFFLVTISFSGASKNSRAFFIPWQLQFPFLELQRTSEYFSHSWSSSGLPELAGGSCAVTLTPSAPCTNALHWQRNP